VASRTGCGAVAAKWAPSCGRAVRPAKQDAAAIETVTTGLGVLGGVVVHAAGSASPRRELSPLAVVQVSELEAAPFVDGGVRAPRP